MSSGATAAHIKDFTDSIQLNGLPHFLRKPDPDVYLSAPYLVLDMETKNAEKGSALAAENDVVCTAWYCPSLPRAGKAKVHFKMGGIFDQEELLRDIEAVLKRGGFIVAHNVKFELQWLKRMGVDLRRVLCYDTMIGDYVLAGNRRWRLSLDACMKRRGLKGKAAAVDAWMQAGICPSTMPVPYLRARVIKDVKDCTRIFWHQRRRLAKRRQLAVQFTRCIFTPVLADIEGNGIGLHKERVYEEYEKTEREYNAALTKFNRLTGGINPRSTAQMAHFVYENLGFSELTDRNGDPVRNKPTKQFPDGAPKVDEATLGKLRTTTDEQREFMALKKEVGKLNARLTKTLHFFKGIVDEYSGTFYGQFNQCVTQTHRLSSSGRRRFFVQYLKELGIQLQNMPGEYKDLICAKDPNKLIAEADGSQLEFRVAGFLGQDQQAIWNIRHDVDQHIYSARIIAGMTEEAWAELEEAVRKALRKKAKPHTFKPLYGGRKGTPDEERYYEWFRGEFHELADTQVRWTERVLSRQYLRMPWGMIFHWPGTRRSRSGYIDNTTQICNYPVQNLATAEIIPIAVTYLWHRAALNDPGIELINTVHDSAIAEIPRGSEKIWKALSIQCFSADVYKYLAKVYELDFDVPLGVGVTVGERWEAPDAVEYEYNVEQDGTYWAKGDRAA